MMELQGSFDFEDNMARNILGHFMWLNDGTACLLIAHQMLEGKAIELDRPFFVIEKKKGDKKVKTFFKFVFQNPKIFRLTEARLLDLSSGKLYSTPVPNLS